ncbi:hypothetical protein AT864_00931 [Anoxybacillus sp. P3H1B]|uniref:hypothetical protein n=1 Tax=Anoxybacillaceae TaxID=3120669 RepID=UPI00079C86DD|nr:MULTISPECIES: hypothetical protein [Anoxybacillus]KXG10340.1 hypothetical protein AT864_00931 [Anoxybacillus sp. P3H1B]
MSNWNPYANYSGFYDNDYDVEDAFRHDNNAPAFPMMPTNNAPAFPTMPANNAPALPTMPPTQVMPVSQMPMPVEHAYIPSCGCQPMPTWCGTDQWMGGSYPFVNPGHVEVGSVVSPNAAPIPNMQPMPGMQSAPMMGMPYPMGGTTGPMGGFPSSSGCCGAPYYPYR